MPCTFKIQIAKGGSTFLNCAWAARIVWRQVLGTLGSILKTLGQQAKTKGPTPCTWTHAPRFSLLTCAWMAHLGPRAFWAASWSLLGSLLTPWAASSLIRKQVSSRATLFKYKKTHKEPPHALSSPPWRHLRDSHLFFYLSSFLLFLVFVSAMRGWNLLF